jgi:hypothetical protein
MRRLVWGGAQLGAVLYLNELVNMVSDVILSISLCFGKRLDAIYQFGIVYYIDIILNLNNAATRFKHFRDILL